MVKMAALAPKGVFEEEDFYVPAWEEPRTSGISTIIRATATKQHKHTAPRTCWYGAPLSFSNTQKPPAVRGNGSTSRMLGMPVRYMIRRSKPRPKPACSTVPKRRSSRYHS